MKAAHKIRVVLVDDSALVRQTLSALLQKDPAIEVSAVAADPLFALDKMRRVWPDVVLTALALPRMDGLQFLKQIMHERPTPVVVYFSAAGRSAVTTLQLMAAGASAVLPLPEGTTATALSEAADELIAAIKSAVHHPSASLRPHMLPVAPPPRLTADAILPARAPGAVPGTEPIVAIGASTGGTEALTRVLMPLPADVPGIVVVQHMPAGFTAAFAARLNEQCAMEVREARDGDTLQRGCVLIAPGGRHLLLQRQGTHYTVAIDDGPPVGRHRPAVDVLFRSVAQAAGRNAMGIIMTGMGNDGAQGLLEMLQAGAATIAQDEASSVVFGMPKEAIALGAVERVMALDAISQAIRTWHTA